MMTEQELTLLREEQLRWMPQRSTIKRRDYVGGEEVHIPQTIATGVKCRLTPGFGLWRQIADRFQGITAYTGTFPYGTDIKAADELIDDTSRTFQVRDSLHPKAHETAVRVLLDLVTD